MKVLFALVLFTTPCLAADPTPFEFLTKMGQVGEMGSINPREINNIVLRAESLKKVPEGVEITEIKTNDNIIFAHLTQKALRANISRGYSQPELDVCIIIIFIPGKRTHWQYEKMEKIKEKWKTPEEWIKSMPFPGK